MTSNIQPSTSSNESKRAVNRSKLPTPQLKLYNKNFSFEEMCFLTHHANYCTDFKALRETFKLQFQKDRSLDSIERALTECEDEEFFILTDNAERYKKWYTEHPMNPVCPIILLGSRAMRTELRAYLAYHHHHGMGFADLKSSFNSTFPTETRDSKQITAQLNHFKKNNQLLNTLSNFSARYPWHPKYQPAPSVTGKAPARARPDLKKQRAKNWSDNQVAKATQVGLTDQRVESEESLAAQRELVEKYTNMFGIFIADPRTSSTATIMGRDLFDYVEIPVSGPHNRSGHAAGRARSASPDREDTRGEGGAKRERRRSL